MVQAHIIVSILVGAGYSHKLLPYQNMKTGVEEMMTAGQVMDRIMPDIMSRVVGNPLIAIFPWLMDKPLTASDRRYFANCKTLRDFIRGIIVEKKKTKDPESGDFISLILEDPNY